MGEVGKSYRLLEAAHRFHAMLDRLDQGLEPTPKVVAEFKAEEKALTTEVDVHKDNYAGLEDSILRLRTMKKAADVRIKQLLALQEAIKDDARKMLEALPGVTIRDSLGKKIYLSPPGKPSIDYSIDLDTKTISNIIDLSDLKKVDPKYRKTVQFLTLDTEAIRTDLEAGVNIPWAKLDDTKAVVGLAPSKPDTKDIVTND